MPIQTQFPTTFIGPMYLLGPFRFTTTQSAPLASSYTEPGAAGSLTVTDTSNKLSTSGGLLQIGSPTAAYTDPRMISASSFARLAGRAVLATARIATGGGWRVGWHANTSLSPSAHAWLLHAAGFILIFNGSVIIFSGLSINTDYELALILRSSGAFYLIKISGIWTLFWVDVTPTTSPLYAGQGTHDQGGTAQADNFRVTDLGGAWASDYGIALARSTFTASDGTALTALTPEVGPTWTVQSGTWQVTTNRLRHTAVPQGIATVETGQADVLIEATILPANVSAEHLCGIVFRYQDVNNYWYARFQCNDGGGRLYEAAGGIFTIRSSVTAGGAFSTVTPTRIVVVAAGATIKVYVNNSLWVSYTSAATGLAATQHGLSTHDADGIVSFDDFVVWPRTVSLPAGV